MTTPNSGDAGHQNGRPSDDMVMLVYVDGTIKYVESQVDTTIKPMSEASKKLLEADRENVDLWINYSKELQAKHNAKQE